MFLSQINPVLARLWQFEIRYYGLIYSIGLVITYFFLRYLVKQRNIKLSKEGVADFVFYGIIGVIIGARLFYIIFYNLPYFLANPAKMPAVWDGGLSWHGGLTGMIIAELIFCKRKRVSFLEMADITVIPASVCLMLGRIGNFINGELYGRIASLPWAVKFQGAEGFRHPSQLYESFKNLAIFSILWALKDKRLKKGVMFSLFLIMFSSFRFAIEFLRQPDEQIGFIFGIFSMGQILNIPVLLCGIGLLAYFHKYYKPKK
jgi:phosphatidylglycerol:prolipoprotein diacylglycerol transferase